jgi:MoxR-like ATPase
MTLEPYPSMENMHLENVYKGFSDRTYVDFKDEHGEEYIIDLKTMTEFPKKNPKETIEVIRREKIQGIRK